MKKGKKNNNNNKNKKAEHINNKRLEREQRKKLRSMKYKEDPEWKKDFLRFEIQLKKIGFEIIDVPGDGNCLFRSISDQMGEGTNNHSSYRKQVVEYIRENRFDFEPFLDNETFEDFLKRISKDKEWGGNLELAA